MSIFSTQRQTFSMFMGVLRACVGHAPPKIATKMGIWKRNLSNTLESPAVPLPLHAPDTDAAFAFLRARLLARGLLTQDTPTLDLSLWQSPKQAPVFFHLWVAASGKPPQEYTLDAHEQAGLAYAMTRGQGLQTTLRQSEHHQARVSHPGTSRHAYMAALVPGSRAITAAQQILSPRRADTMSKKTARNPAKITESLALYAKELRQARQAVSLGFFAGLLATSANAHITAASQQTAATLQAMRAAAQNPTP